MKPLYLLMTISLLLCFAIQADPAHAQEKATSLYLLTSSDTAFTVIALNPLDGSSVNLFSVPTSARGVISQLFPAGEIDALNRYFADYNVTSRHPIGSISELWTRARLDSISASPDNRQVVAKVIYQTCFVPQNPVCFGTTQLILIDQASQDQRVLLNLGSHDDQFLPIIYEDPEMLIGQVQWTPDQQAVVIEISNRGTRRNSVDSAIVVVPIAGTLPFKIGDGLTWASASNGEQIAILSKSIPGNRGLPNTLSIVNFDAQTGQFSQSSYVLENYVVYDRAGLAFLDRFVVFSKSFDPRLTETTETGGGLSIFDTQTGAAAMVLPNQVFLDIQSTPNASRLVLETSDRLLIEGRLQNGSITVESLISTPVTNWNLGNDGSLAVQYAEGATYQLLDPQGTPIEILPSLSQNQTQAISALEEGEIVAVDW